MRVSSIMNARTATRCRAQIKAIAVSFVPSAQSSVHRFKRSVPAVSSDNSPPTLLHMRHASQAVGVTLHPAEIRDPSEIGTGVAVMIRQRANALLLLPDPLFSTHGKKILHLAPITDLLRCMAGESSRSPLALMAYGPSISDRFGRAAAYVDEIPEGRQARGPRMVSGKGAIH
jgi:hypothetical protein